MTKKDFKFIILPVVFLTILLFSCLCVCKPNILYTNALEDVIAIDDAGTLNNISYLKDCVYAIDENNEQIIKYDLTTKIATKFGGVYDYDNQDTTFLDLNAFCVLNSGDIFVCQKDLQGIKQYNAEFEFIQEYDVVSKSGSIKPMQKIADMQCDFKDSLYALEYGDQTQILLKQPTDESFSVYSTLNIETNENSKLLVSYNSQNIFIFDNNKLYQINGDNYSLLFELDNTISIVDIAMDYKNNFYLLTNAKTILRYEFQTNAYALTQTSNLSKSYTSLALDFETGISYYTINSSFEILENNASFFYSLNSFTHSVDYKNLTPLTAGAKIGKVTDLTVTVYKQPIDIINVGTLQKNDEFIILNDNIVDNPNYVHILLSKEIKQDKVLLEGYILKSTYLLKTTTYVSDFTQPVTTNDFVKVYKYPTTLFYSVEGGYSKLCLTTLEKGQTVKIIDNAYNYHDDNGLVFYQIALDSGIGYVLRSSICEINQNQTTSILSPNAEVKCKKGEIVKVYDDYYKSIEISQIENNCLVHTFKNSEKNGYVKIQYLNTTTNEVVTGYVDADCVKELGTSMYIVLGIGLLLIAVLIVLIIIYCNIKRKKKAKEVEEE